LTGKNKISTVQVTKVTIIPFQMVYLTATYSHYGQNPVTLYKMKKQTDKNELHKNMLNAKAGWDVSNMVMSERGHKVDMITEI